MVHGRAAAMSPEMHKGTAPLASLGAASSEVAALMRVLSHPDRLAILCHLAGGERSVADLQNDLGLRQPGLSQQLSELRDSGLVGARRVSRSVFYSLADERACAILDALDTIWSGRAPAPRPARAPAPERPAQEAAHFARLD